MPDALTNATLTIAHHLPPVFEAALAATLPSDFLVRRLGNSWDIPPEADVLITVPQRGTQATAPVEKPPGWPHNLRWVHTASAGVDEFPPWLFEAPLVTCGRGTNSAPIAEYVLAALLSAVKHVPEIWIHDEAEWRPRELGTLDGKVLGLVGYGSIGQAIAARAAPFGMKILATSRSANAGAGAHGVPLAPLDTVLAQADHLVIALPLTPATAGLIGRAALARVKPGVHLVNIARGRLLDQEALREALDSGRVGLATLDVTEPEPLPAGHWLYTHKRVRLSPHISWSNGERGRAAAALFAENLQRFLAGEPLLGRVDARAGY
jgi:phosphoglycerate dehydrogenase-like enzyme